MDPMNLTGAWFGRYAYDAGAGPATGFIASITEAAGVIDGQSSERDLMGRGAGLLLALLAGARNGASVRFTKTYTNEPGLAPIAYQGTLDQAGERIAGVWSLPGLTGTFEMTRKHAAEEEEAAGAGRALVVVSD